MKLQGLTHGGGLRDAAAEFKALVEANKMCAYEPTAVLCVFVLAVHAAMTLAPVRCKKAQRSYFARIGTSLLLYVERHGTCMTHSLVPSYPSEYITTADPQGEHKHTPIL